MDIFIQHGWSRDLWISSLVPYKIKSFLMNTCFSPLFYLFSGLVVAVCILVMQRPGVMLKPFK
jgi:hypothetical protein